MLGEHSTRKACKSPAEGEKQRRNRGCLPFIKKIPEILVGNFRSVRTVRVVYQLPKISGLSRCARLDSSYNMKLDSAKLKKLVNGK